MDTCAISAVPPHPNCTDQQYYRQQRHNTAFETTPRSREPTKLPAIDPAAITKTKILLRPSTAKLLLSIRGNLAGPGSIDEQRRIVQRVAFYRSIDKELDYAAMRLRIDYRIVKKLNRRALDRIAACLRRYRIKIF